MSLTVVIAIFAVVATLAAAFLQPLVNHWLTPKQKLRVDITGARYSIPSLISSEMSKYYYFKLRERDRSPKPEFGDFLRDAERYGSFFDVSVTNTGSTICRNVFLGCSAYGKYVLIESRNRSEYHPDQPEYLLGDLQPSEKVRCQIWATSSFPEYDFIASRMFSARDDHNSSKQIVLRRCYDRTSHYVIDREAVATFTSLLKWTLFPPVLTISLIYLGVWAFHRIWS